MCFISFESTTLGFAYWTNTTNEVIKGALKKKSRQPDMKIPFVKMKYNDVGNFLEIQVQRDKVRDFQGLSIIQIALGDEE